jgi:uncharacterized protein (TIGR02284 family)
MKEPMYTGKMTNKLNQLLTKNYEAEVGYSRAAAIVKNQQLQQFFETQAQARYNFGNELKTEIRNTSGTSEQETSVKGDAHSMWMSIKGASTSNDEKSVLEEVTRGEKTAVEEYQGVILDVTLPPTTKGILTKQVLNIENTLRSIKNFQAIVA